MSALSVYFYGGFWGLSDPTLSGQIGISDLHWRKLPYCLGSCIL